MNLTITPTKLKGTITPPPSKSMAHRLILCAALSRGRSVIENVARSLDIEATLRCVSAMGTCVEDLGNDSLCIHGMGNSVPQADGPLIHFDCGESGSTLRFMIPIALAVVGGGVFTGSGRLMERPLQPYFHLFEEKGIFYEQKDGVLTVRGRLQPGEYRLPGDVSSQFFTGLLYALPLLDGDSTIVSTTAVESIGYINMTRRAMEAFGVKTDRKGNAFHVAGNQHFQQHTAAVEADWSQAAFWYAAACVGNDITVTGMDNRSLQLDRLVVDYMDMILNRPLRGGMTAAAPIYQAVESEKTPTAPPVVPHSGGCGVGLDVRHVPDLVPPLAAMGAFMNGSLTLKNAGRLRMKESDRLATVAATLNALGARVTEGADRLIIEGQPSLRGGVTIDCCNDHRIAMMAAIAATGCRETVTLLGAECVQKSYPNFWEHYQMLGGLIHEHTGE